MAYLQKHEFEQERAVQRSPIDANCTANTAICVTLCPNETDSMQQGNWTSGNCAKLGLFLHG